MIRDPLYLFARARPAALTVTFYGYFAFRRVTEVDPSCDESKARPREIRGSTKPSFDPRTCAEFGTDESIKQSIFYDDFTASVLQIGQVSHKTTWA